MKLLEENKQGTLWVALSSVCLDVVPWERETKVKIKKLHQSKKFLHCTGNHQESKMTASSELAWRLWETGEIPQKIKARAAIRPIYSSYGYLSKENKITHSERQVRPYVPYRITYNSQDTDTTGCALIGSWISCKYTTPHGLRTKKEILRSQQHGWTSRALC